MLVYRVAVALFGLLWLSLAARLGSAVPEGGPEFMLLVLTALAAGHLLADLVSGLVHWFADEFFEEDSPIVGPLLITGFREHHRRPRDILLHDALEVSGYNALVCLPVLLALWWWPAATQLGSIAHAVLLATTLSVLATNQLHKWAHADRVPATVAWLQRGGVILSREAHACHHARGDRAYCVTAGWLNPALDATGVLRAVARRIHAAAGPASGEGRPLIQRRRWWAALAESPAVRRDWRRRGSGRRAGVGRTARSP